MGFLVVILLVVTAVKYLEISDYLPFEALVEAYMILFPTDVHIRTIISKIFLQNKYIKSYLVYYAYSEFKYQKFN